MEEDKLLDPANVGLFYKITEIFQLGNISYLLY